MGLLEYLVKEFAPFLSLGGIVALINIWFLERLKNSIKHEYDKSLEKFKGELKAKHDEELEEIKAILKKQTDQSLEDYRFQVEVRKKAELVANLLAHWLTYPEKEEELNRMTFECFLWLPDTIALDLSKLLTHKDKNQVTVRSVIISIRKHLNLNSSAYSLLNERDVIVFEEETRKKQWQSILASLEKQS